MKWGLHLPYNTMFFTYAMFYFSLCTSDETNDDNGLAYHSQQNCISCDKCTKIDTNEVLTDRQSTFTLTGICNQCLIIQLEILLSV